MNVLGKGDWVQCVKPVMVDGVGARRGAVYCVEAVVPWFGECDCCGPVDVGVVLVGVRLPPTYGFCQCAFSPLGGDHVATEAGARVCEPA